MNTCTRIKVHKDDLLVVSMSMRLWQCVFVNLFFRGDGGGIIHSSKFCVSITCWWCRVHVIPELRIVSTCTCIIIHSDKLIMYLWFMLLSISIKELLVKQVIHVCNICIKIQKKYTSVQFYVNTWISILLVKNLVQN